MGGGPKWSKIFSKVGKKVWKNKGMSALQRMYKGGKGKGLKGLTNLGKSASKGGKKKSWFEMTKKERFKHYGKKFAQKAAKKVAKKVLSEAGEELADFYGNRLLGNMRERRERMPEGSARRMAADIGLNVMADRSTGKFKTKSLYDRLRKLEAYIARRSAARRAENTMGIRYRTGVGRAYGTGKRKKRRKKGAAKKKKRKGKKKKGGKRKGKKKVGGKKKKKGRRRGLAMMNVAAARSRLPRGRDVFEIQ